MAKGSARGIRAGKAFVEIGAKDKLSADLKRLQARIAAFGAAVQHVGTRIAMAGAAAVVPFALATRHFVEAGSALHDMSQRTGVAVESLSQLDYVAKLAGVSMSELEVGVRFMQRTIADARADVKTATDALASLGLTVEQLGGLSPEKQFALIGKHLSQMADPAEKANAAMDIFGRSGTALIPMLAGLEAGLARANLLGLTIPAEAAARADDLGDALDEMWQLAKNAAFWVGDALAPALTIVAKTGTAVLMMLRDLIREHPRLVGGAALAAAAVMAFGTALATTGIIVRGFAFAIGGLSIAMKGLALTTRLAGVALRFLLRPVVLIGAAVLGIAVGILHLTGQLKPLLTWFGFIATRIAGSIEDIIEQFPVLQKIKAFVTGDLGDLDFSKWDQQLAEWSAKLDAIGGGLDRVSSLVTFDGRRAPQLLGPGGGHSFDPAAASEKELKYLREISKNTRPNPPTYE